MDITQTTHVREILLVKPTPDAPWVAHQKKITITSGAPFPIPDQYGEPEAINPAEIGDVLPAIFTDLEAERNAAVAAKAQALSAQQAAEAEAAQLAGQLSTATSDIQTKAADIATLTEQLTTKTAECQALQAQLAAALNPGSTEEE